ncbi:MAG: serine hydrolase [Patescibacteria group bacterium]
MNPFRKHVGTAFLTSCAVSALFVLVFSATMSFQKNALPAAVSQATSLPSTADFPVTAHAAYVYDASTGRVLFEKNANAQLPLASITKVMLALVAHETIPLDAVVHIRATALGSEGDTGLHAGEEWQLQDLIDATLVPSSNDGALALAYETGNRLPGDEDPVKKTVEAMNRKARALGLAQTYFLNPTGLDESLTTAGAYGSARDIAALLHYAIRERPEALQGTARDGTLLMSLSGIEHVTHNTNVSIPEIPGLLAGKTGFTDLAGGNLAVVFDASIGRPIFVVVLGSTHEGRFQDVERLVQLARDNL